MWAQGSQRGLAWLGVIKSDLVGLNQRWLRLIKTAELHDHSLVVDQFRISRPLARACRSATTPLLAEAANFGAPLFYIKDTDTFALDLARVLEHGRLPPPRDVSDPHLRRFTEERRAFGYAYLSMLREIIGHDPVLATTLLGIEDRLLPLAQCSIEQITALSRADSLVFAPRHAEALRLQIVVLSSPDIIASAQRDVLRSWCLIAETPSESAVDRTLAQIGQETVASDSITQLMNVTGLAALGCRLKVTASLTHARKPAIKNAMVAAGMSLEDRGGRRPSRIASLIETTSAHVASSFFLSNYIKARQRYGCRNNVSNADAFITALSISRTASGVTVLDPDLALLISDLYHQGEVSICRCHTCESTHLATRSPVLVRGEVIRGDCPICREVQAMATGQRRVKLVGRRTRLTEVLGQATAQRRLELK